MTNDTTKLVERIHERQKQEDADLKFILDRFQRQADVVRSVLRKTNGNKPLRDDDIDRLIPSDSKARALIAIKNPQFVEHGLRVDSVDGRKRVLLPFYLIQMSDRDLATRVRRTIFDHRARSAERDYEDERIRAAVIAHQLKEAEERIEKAKIVRDRFRSRAYKAC